MAPEDGDEKLSSFKEENRRDQRAEDVVSETCYVAVDLPCFYLIHKRRIPNEIGSIACGGGDTEYESPNGDPEACRDYSHVLIAYEL